MEFKRITEYSETVFRDLDALHRELSSSGRGLKEDNLKAALNDKNVFVMGLYDGSRIIGTATLTIIRAISDLKGYMDDVVVDEAYRGRGLGKQLVQHMIDLAKELKLNRMEFTSRRSRIAANAMYQKMGFVVKDSNAYKMEF